MAADLLVAIIDVDTKRNETKRNDYIVDELPLLDQLNIKDLNDFALGSLDIAINEIKHK